MTAQCNTRECNRMKNKPGRRFVGTVTGVKITRRKERLFLGNEVFDINFFPPGTNNGKPLLSPLPPLRAPCARIIRPFKPLTKRNSFFIFCLFSAVYDFPRLCLRLYQLIELFICTRAFILFNREITESRNIKLDALFTRTRV